MKYLLLAYFSTMYMDFKYGWLIRDVTECFTFHVFNWVFTFIIWGGSCNILLYFMYWEIIFFFCKTSPHKLFYEFNVGSHPILMEQELEKNSHVCMVVVFPIFFI